MREPAEGKFGRAVMTIAVITSVVLLVLAVLWITIATVRRQFNGKPIEHREATHPDPLHS